MSDGEARYAAQARLLFNLLPGDGAGMPPERRRAGAWFCSCRKLQCFKNVGLCAVLAQGTLALELAMIPSLAVVDVRGQQLSGAPPAWPPPA